MSWYLLLPLTSSLMYAAAALFLKRAAVLGCGVVKTTAVVNVATAIALLAVLPLGGTMHWDVYWQPLIVGLLFVAGQGATLLALKLGDVSVATPVMGAKTVIVAVLATVMLAEDPPWQLWVAAVLSAGAIGLLNASGGEKRRVLPALAAWPVANSVGRSDDRLAWPWLAGGAILMAVQALLLTGTIAVFGDATAVNVVYSARGLWAVAAVMVVGQWFRNDERLLGPRVLRSRLCGAAMMTAAIVIAMTR